MQLTKIIEAMELEVLTPVAEDREVLGGYTGDLLSWVMGRAESEMLWITIMTNVSIASHLPTAPFQPLRSVVKLSTVTFFESVAERKVTSPSKVSNPK